MRNWKRVATSLVILAGAAAFTGCSGQAYQLNSAASNAMPTPAVTVTATPTPTSTSTLPPPLNFTGTFTGSTGTAPTFTTPTINTDSTLQVLITPGPAQPINTPVVNPTGAASNSSFTANYNCVQYTLVIMGATTTTQLLALNQNQNCYNASGTPMNPNYGLPLPATSQYIDFSGYLTSGHGPITISVTGASTDMYCQWLADNWDNPASSAYGELGWTSFFCPVKPLYVTDVATVNISVGIDGTLSPNPATPNTPAEN